MSDNKHVLKQRWWSMIGRCRGTENKDPYTNYSLRGIQVCDEWKDDFEKFYEWSIKNGFQKQLQLDRIDNNGDYSPDNCRYVSSSINNRNKRNSKFFTYQGEQKTIAEWSEIFNIPYQIFYGRLRLGWSIDKIILTPIKIRSKVKKKEVSSMKTINRIKLENSEIETLTKRFQKLPENERNYILGLIQGMAFGKFSNYPKADTVQESNNNQSAS